MMKFALYLIVSMSPGAPAEEKLLAHTVSYEVCDNFAKILNEIPDYGYTSRAVCRPLL